MSSKDIDEVPMTPTSQDTEDRERLLENADDADKLQPPEATGSLVKNLYSNSAPIAQAGVWLLAGTFWAACFKAGLIFFSAHVLLNTTGILLLTQSILILQPTSTPLQKRRGTAFHFLFNSGSLSALLAGLVIIEINKFAHDGAHFRSLHAILGLLVYLLLLAQGVIGFTQYYTPMLYGSVDRAKSVWKYHRMTGYVTVVLGLLVLAAATGTGYARDVLGVPLWWVGVAEFFVLAGLVPRVSLKKFGFGR